MASARRWAVAWACAALMLVPVNAADTNGVPFGYVFGSLGDYLESTQTTQAWLLTAVIALAIAIGCWLTTTWRWTIGMAVLVVLASLPTVVTAQVSVGAGHDLATDASIFFTLATTLWIATIWATHRTASAIGVGTTLRRSLRIGGVAVIIAIATRTGIGLWEMAGQSFFDWAYGVALIAIMIVLVALAVRIAVRWARIGRSAEPGKDTRRHLGCSAEMRVDVALSVIFIGLQTALLRLVPPRFLVRQTTTENYLGYNLPSPPRVPKRCCRAGRTCCCWWSR